MALGWQVAWPRMVVRPVGGGEVLLVKGDLLPDGVADRDLDALQVSGGIVGVTVPDPEPVVVPVEVPARPTTRSSRDEWDAYASTLGLVPGDFSTKPALIEAVEAAEQALGAPGDHSPAPAGGEGDEPPAGGPSLAAAAAD